MWGMEKDKKKKSCKQTLCRIEAVLNGLLGLLLLTGEADKVRSAVWVFILNHSDIFSFNILALFPEKGIAPFPFFFLTVLGCSIYLEALAVALCSFPYDTRRRHRYTKTLVKNSKEKGANDVFWTAL